MVERRRLPDRRPTQTQKVKINGQTIHLGMGEYPEGDLGEIWVDVNKAGSAFRGLMEGMARLFSISLQYGVPLTVLIGAIKGIQFEPCGAVVGETTKVSHATSLLDYVAKELEALCLNRDQPA